MFAYIKGIPQEITSEFAVIDNGGIGYKVNMPFSESSKLSVGSEEKIHTYMYIREEILDLYGFVSKESLDTFELLIGISGVGPKAAVAVLNTFSPEEFSRLLENGDYKAITKTPGIGAKTAQRIVLELKGKLEIAGTAAPLAAPAGGMAEEAAEALTALGYSPADARDAVFKAGAASDVSALIKAALKQLM